MARKETYDRVAKVTARVLNVAPADIKPESNFVFDLGAESTQSVELVAAFEGEFNVEMDEESALGVKTVGDAVDFIAGYVK